MKWDESRVLITGVSGFVGSYLARNLVDKGANVYGLIRRRADGAIPKNIAHNNIEDSITYVEGSLEDLPGLTHAIETAEPDYIFHLAAQSFVPRSFSHPLETAHINGIGTMNLLEAVRQNEVDPVMLFAGTSEEYGLVISSEEQYTLLKTKYGSVFPEPSRIPELPISENNPFRPMSPYATSKVYGEFLFRNYFHTYGLKTLVSRSFNHEGAGRGNQFVTSVITSQVTQLNHGEIDQISIGNVNACRDWSHIDDIIEGYQLIARKGQHGDVYNVGSNRTTSVLSYLLSSIEASGHTIHAISTVQNEKHVKNPLSSDKSSIFGVSFEKPLIDQMILSDEISFGVEDKGILVKTEGPEIRIQFDPDRFRPSEVPILFSDITKIQHLGYQVRHSIDDIIRDQMNFFMDSANRCYLTCSDDGKKSPEK
ncbi:MAG: GDP-mannose 4,6-dehydratase [Methanospirillum sp.]|uniref:GDP-mannose 4,6-dehydratase n=1 Tax=Methanospirillum sp. TaxID=45200 RepID=UPI00236E1B2A|nr:GDP-mannose 4,6-dehydratase [Methanospirillum sp.]MDD1730095.1 GDP-mannose 4,6-dehydratase [Methanospirillum sp.]